jgi:small subunit ribosomal protein S1
LLVHHPQCHAAARVTQIDDEDFAAMFEAEADSASGARKLEAGQVIDGIVVAIDADTVFVDVGTRSEGRIERRSLENERGELAAKVGDKIRATVRDPGRGVSPLLVVAFGSGKLDVRELEIAAASGTPIEGTFTKAVKAGLELDLGGRRAFCPASQVDLTYVNDLASFEGQHHFFKVLEVRDNGRSVVVSRRALLEDERRAQAKVLSERLEPGMQLDGIIQSLQPYGAFVDIGGLQGLLHVSEISHTRIGAPSDALSVGEKVRVEVLSIEPANGDRREPRVSLSMKSMTQPSPSTGAPSAEVITAKVAKIEHHGLFVDTSAGSGFVPSAELGLPPGSDPRRAHAVGDTLDVVLVRKDPSGKLRFSAKAVEDVEARKAFAAFRDASGKKGQGKGFGSLGDLLGDKLDLPARPAKAAAPERSKPERSRPPRPDQPKRRSKG